MRVSIIVPVYNVERYLRKCLESLRKQTLEDIEIICVDDGSTDGSLTILREYETSDARFKVITKPNAGYGNSMNLGFDAAQGEFVGVLESDDFCSEDMCEKLYWKAVDCEADIVRANIWLYWSRPVERTELVQYVSAGDACDSFNPREQKQCFLLPPALCCMLVKRSVIADNNLRMRETPGASYQDTSFSFKLWACAKRAVMTTEAFVYYRQDNESSSINQPDKLYCVPEEYRELERYLRGEELHLDELLTLMEKRKFSAYLWNYRRIASEFHREFADYMAKEFLADRERSLFDPELFSSEEWSDLLLLMDDPARFVARMDSWSEAAIRRFHALSRVRRKLSLRGCAGGA